MRLRDDIAKTIYASDAAIRRSDAPFDTLSGPLLSQYQRNAEHIIEEHILPILTTIANVVDELEGDGEAKITMATHALDALLEDYDYGELKEIADEQG